MRSQEFYDRWDTFAALGLKECRRCKEPRPLSAFARAKSRDGRQAHCRTCNNAMHADRRAEDPEAHAARASAWYLERTYGLTTAQHQDMLEAQGGRCAICHTDSPGNRGWQVDHDHATGSVRGLLCRACNLGLGNFRDDPVALEAAIRYLEVHRGDARYSGAHDAT